MRHAASSVSGIVTGSRLAMRRPTGTSYWIDTPRSPRSALQSQCAYWIAIGRFSPIASRSRAAASGLPSVPMMMSAGSPGSTRTTTKTMRETKNRVATNAATRLRRWRRTFPRRLDSGRELAPEPLLHSLAYVFHNVPRQPNSLPGRVLRVDARRNTVRQAVRISARDVVPVEDRPLALEIGLERLLPHLLGEKAGDVVSPTLRQMVGPPKVLFGLLQPAPALLKRASSQRGAPPRAAPGARTADPSSPRTRPGYSRSRPYQRPRRGASRVTLTARGAPCRFSTRRAHRDP